MILHLAIINTFQFVLQLLAIFCVERQFFDIEKKVGFKLLAYYNKYCKIIVWSLAINNRFSTELEIA